MNNEETIAVLGAGSFGLTLTWLLSQAGKHVSLYTSSQEKEKVLNEQHKIEKPLAVEFNQHNVTVTSKLGTAIKNKTVIIICCTSQSMRAIVQELATCPDLNWQEAIVVSAVKGLELHSLKRMSEILKEVLPSIKIAVLSGPNLAAEILQGLPAAAVIASDDMPTAVHVQKLLSQPKFRLYSNTDVIGVELGGTLKNIIAIAAGTADGLKIGANAKAALLTRGLAEMTRLAVHLGAKPLTLAGLAGLGDLLASCNGTLSRNYNLGLEMAAGKSLQTIVQQTGAVIEGITTTQAVCQLGEKLNIELPVAKLVQALLNNSLSPVDAIMALMNRPLVSE